MVKIFAMYDEFVGNLDPSPSMATSISFQSENSKGHSSATTSAVIGATLLKLSIVQAGKGQLAHRLDSSVHFRAKS
jgi:hypothetical protein